jgi:hypothetical protein
MLNELNVLLSFAQFDADRCWDLGRSTGPVRGQCERSSRKTRRGGADPASPPEWALPHALRNHRRSPRRWSRSAASPQSRSARTRTPSSYLAYPAPDRRVRFAAAAGSFCSGDYHQGRRAVREDVPIPRRDPRFGRDDPAGLRHNVGFGPDAPDVAGDRSRQIDPARRSVMLHMRIRRPNLSSRCHRNSRPQQMHGVRLYGGPSSAQHKACTPPDA